MESTGRCTGLSSSTPLYLSPGSRWISDLPDVRGECVRLSPTLKPRKKVKAILELMKKGDVIFLSDPITVADVQIGRDYSSIGSYLHRTGRYKSVYSYRVDGKIVIPSRHTPPSPADSDEIRGKMLPLKSSRRSEKQLSWSEKGFVIPRESFDVVAESPASSRIGVLYREWLIRDDVENRMREIGRRVISEKRSLPEDASPELISAVSSGEDEGSRRIAKAGLRTMEMIIIATLNLVSSSIYKGRDDFRIWTEASLPNQRSPIWIASMTEEWREFEKFSSPTFLKSTGFEIEEVGIQEIVRKRLDSEIEFNSPVDENGNIGMAVLSADVTLPSREDRRIGVKKFRRNSTLRIENLIELGGVENTLCVLLYYSAICAGGQQWTYTKSMESNRRLGIDTEGFASPLNSLSIAIREGREWAVGALESKFCSISKAVDGPFGSIGDFFVTEEIKGRNGVSINPPYVEVVLKRAAERALDLLENDWVKVVTFIGPDWSDAEFYEILSKSKYLLSRQIVTWVNMGAFSFDFEAHIKMEKKIFYFILSRDKSYKERIPRFGEDI